MNSFVLSVLFFLSSGVFKTRKGDRRVFFFPSKNGRGRPIFACGVSVTYKNNRGIKKTLFVKETSRVSSYVSDLGGKTEMEDGTVFETLTREVWEESSHKFFGDEMCLEEFREVFKCFLDNSRVILKYVPKSKYLLVKVECDKNLPDECMGLIKAPLTRFDAVEGCIMREFFWLKKNDYRQIENFHPRLGEDFC